MTIIGRMYQEMGEDDTDDSDRLVQRADLHLWLGYGVAEGEGRRMSWMVSFTKEAAVQNTAYFQNQGKAVRVYAFPKRTEIRTAFEHAPYAMWPVENDERGRAKFWAFAICAGTSFADIRESHINDDKDTAVEITIAQLQSLERIPTDHYWRLSIAP